MNITVSVRQTYEVHELYFHGRQCVQV